MQEMVGVNQKHRRKIKKIFLEDGILERKSLSDSSEEEAKK